MPDGKPAGVRCIHLTPANLCAIYGQPDRPEICGRLRATVEMCGTTAEEALAWLTRLELDTLP